MPAFRDATGELWAVAIDGVVWAKITRFIGIDLSAVTEAELRQLPWEKLGGMIYLACRPQMNHYGVSPAEFAQRIFPDDVREQATQAFLEAMRC